MRGPARPGGYGRKPQIGGLNTGTPPMRFLPQKGNNTAIRGAKNPAKIGVFMVLAWILAIVGMISVGAQPVARRLRKLARLDRVRGHHRRRDLRHQDPQGRQERPERRTPVPSGRISCRRRTGCRIQSGGLSRTPGGACGVICGCLHREHAGCTATTARYCLLQPTCRTESATMFTTTPLDTIQRAAASGAYTIAPVSREILADDITPIEALRAFKAVSDRCYLLESVVGRERARTVHLPRIRTVAGGDLHRRADNHRRQDLPHRRPLRADPGDPQPVPQPAHRGHAARSPAVWLATSPSNT